jgi:hypothetical protein
MRAAFASQNGFCEGYNGATVVTQTQIAKRCEALDVACAESKKRHVESLTRLPTKRMATACWAFIVAKRPPRKTAPLLDFGSLQDTNIEIHPQDIHKWLWTNSGYFSHCQILLPDHPKFDAKTSIAVKPWINRPLVLK